MRPACRTWGAALFAFLAAFASTGPAEAGQVVIAFGDSVTLGQVFDEQNRGGYPGRLQRILRREEGFEEVNVINSGVGGETTSVGASRLNFVLGTVPPRDLCFVIIMEGTNDVNQILSGLTSISTVVSNIERMAGAVRGRGAVPIYSTIIPRSNRASSDRNSLVTFALVVGIRDLTTGGNRQLAEPWEIFFFTPNRNRRIYFQGSDPVGHPNGAGFDLLAEHFADKILGLDKLGPVFSGLDKTGSPTTLSGGDRFRAVMHESGEGIARDSVFFTLNGQPLETTVNGNRRRIELSAQARQRDLGCAGRLGVHAEDRATPVNVRDLVLAEFDVPGANNPPEGDVDGDCRVDGEDLVAFARGFGSEEGDPRYNPALDFTGDGRINGRDFSRLASNFGRDRS